MKSLISLTVSALLVITALPARPQPPYEEGNPGSGGPIEKAVEENDPAGFSSPVDPHPDALNTSICDYHGTTNAIATSSLYGPTSDSTYAAFESSLVGPKGNTGLTIQNQVEYHHVGGASVVIIEDGHITQHHWYGCQDRPAAQRTTANTIYQAASLSKFVSAIGVVIADRQGVVDLNRSAQSYADAHPDSLLAEWVDEKFTNSYPQSITLRRLLNHTAGLDTHGINSWEPGNVPTMRDILMGSDEFDGYFDGGVQPIFAPKTVIEYSGGGYIVAEHILELESPLSFKDYLQQHVLDAAGLSLSTFDKAQTSMTNLARPYSCLTCSSDILQTNVKAAGGLLANAREYAELYVWHTKMWIWKAAKMAGAACPTLKWQDRKTVGRAVPAIKLARLQHNSRSWCTAHIVTALVNGGVTDSGHIVMQQSDIDAILTPAAHDRSTFEPCSNPGATKTIEQGTVIINGTVFQLAPRTETCVAGQYREVLLDGTLWRGLGVQLSTTVESDGYPRTVLHSGDQTGARTYFKIDRRTGDGIVIMINGDGEWVNGDEAWIDGEWVESDGDWVDGDGFTYGARPLLEEIKTAYNATY